MALAATALAALALGPASAQADYPLCSVQGSGAGECNDPRGVAVDSASGTLYVADRGNRRVNAYEVEGGEFEFAFGWGVDTGAAELQKCTAASGCQAGIAGSGAGQFSSPTRIAVDNSGGAEQGKVYVGTDNFRVQKFEPDGGFELAFGWGVRDGSAELQACTEGTGCLAGLQGAAECQISASRDALAVGPGGVVFAADNPGSEPDFTARIQRYSPGGECLSETTLLEGDFRLQALAVDSEEGVYVAVDRAGGALRKYDLESPGAPVCELDPDFETNGLAVDGEDHLFASQREDRPAGGITQVVSEYGPGCSGEEAEVLSRFGYGGIGGNLEGLAAYSSSEGDVFGSERGGEELVRYLSIPDPGPIVAPESVEASARSVWASIEAEANPEGKASTARVEWVPLAAWESEGFASPETRSGGEVQLEGEDFRLKQVEASAGCRPFTQEAFEEGLCLEPETTYRYRIAVENEDGEGAVEGQFTTLDPIEVGEIFATGVGLDSARLGAEVNPLGAPATGYFEYVTESAFAASGFEGASRAPAGGEIEFGAGEETVRALTPLGGLLPGTAYRYRLVADNTYLEAPIRTEPRSFRTFASPRAPEPCANDSTRLGAAERLPDCRAYELVSPLEKAGGDIVTLPQVLTNLPAVLNQSSSGGSRLTYGSYRAFAGPDSAPYTSQYLASRGAGGWSNHFISPPIAKSIKGSAELDFEFRAFSADLCQGWLIPFAGPTLAAGAIPDYINLYRREDRLCGAETYTALSAAKPENADLPQELGNLYEIELQGVSADGAVAAFAANDSLEGSGAPDDGTRKVRLYVSGEEEEAPRFACVLPGGTPSPSPCGAGSTSSAAAFPRSRSANVTDALSADGSRLYWTNAAGEGRIYLRRNPLGEGAECAGDAAPCTVQVSKDAEVASETERSHFWAAAADGSRAIFSTLDPPAGVSDLYAYDAESEEVEPIAEDFRGFLGADEDATVAYFVSGEVLSGAEENGAGEKAEAGENNLYRHEAGEGGGSYEFVGVLADADLIRGATDSSAATGAEPRFHNGRVGADGEHAIFMSAAPLTGYDNTDAKSGEPDTEVFLHDGASGELRCVSCNPSGARPEGVDLGSEASPFWVAARIPAYSTTLRAPRVLTDNGRRAFFESPDPLVARDTNGQIDVYQWEETGEGGCKEADPAYSPAAGGCVELISSGQSERDATLVDSSASGADVFFTTLSSLYPADYGLVDVYDARVDGGFPAPPLPPPPCEGEGCQSPPPAPPFDSPASATYSGPGDLATPTPRARCARAARRAARLARRARRLRSAARRSRAPGARRARAARARRASRAARKLSTNAKRCRARARAQRGRR